MGLTLDLDTAIARVSYRVGDAQFTREMFSSAPDQVLVVRLTSDRPGKLTCTVELTRLERALTRAVGADQLAMQGQLINGPTTNGLRFLAQLRVLNEGGAVTPAGAGSLRIDRADAVTLVLAAATEYRPQPPDYRGHPFSEVVDQQLSAAAQRSYAALRERHVADHQALFRRVSLDTNTDSRSTSAAPILPEWKPPSKPVHAVFPGVRHTTPNGEGLHRSCQGIV